MAADSLDAMQPIVNDMMGLHESELIRLDIGAEHIGQPIRPTFEIGGELLTLDLKPHSVRAANYRVMYSDAEGNLTPADPKPVSTLRGVIEGDPGSLVAAGVLQDGLYGRIIASDGTEHWIEPVEYHLGADARGVHVIYRKENVIPGVGVCGSDDIAPAGTPEGALDDGGSPLAGVNQRAELGVDADSFYWNRWGDCCLENRVNQVINQMNVQYERDVNITHDIVVILIRREQVYTSFDSFGLLSQFRSRWINFHGDINRDVAHLFTGRNISGNVIGRAWNIPGPICSNSGAYCFSQSDFNNIFSCATDLSAHELGHLWGAFHCTCPSNTMNPSITCRNIFSAGTRNSIGAHRDSRTCLNPAGPENDNCDDAQSIGNGNFAFTTIDSTDDGPSLPAECDEGNGVTFRRDIWFSYTAPCDGVATASVCNSDYNTKLAVYSTDNCPVGDEVVACSDDACGENGTRSETSFAVQQGERYLVRVGGRTATGSGTLSMSCTEGDPCPEDVDGNGEVEFGDLLRVLSAWGPCNDCPEDVDDSGEVEFGDLLLVLSAWGPCP